MYSCFINSKMSKNLVKMECPFTWDMDEKLREYFNETDETPYQVDEEPLLALINSIMIGYFRAIQGNFENALEILKTTDDILKIFTEKESAVTEASKLVLQHVKQATEYHVLCLTGRMSEANTLLENLKDSSDFQSNDQIATINGFKAVAWTCFHEKGYVEATGFVKLAISNDPKCALWYYILSKNLRYDRRYVKGSFVPSDDERDAIITCCQLSNLPFYKIYLAQMYRESKMFNESKKIYLEMFSLNPKSPRILLILARSFTTFKDFARAKKCFDDLEKYPKTSMFWHYRGLFYEKQGKLTVAAKFLKKATESKNFSADLNYFDVMCKLFQDKFDSIAHLTKMSDKYIDYPVYRQKIFLHKAMLYVFKQPNEKQALTYFLKGIEINPQSEQLQEFMCSSINWKKYNIYNFVLNKLTKFTCEPSCDIQIRNVVQKLKDLCEQHEQQKVLCSFEKVNI